ncbi:bifunctional adenosylcobinamide kinase/adenosylcobinamide-phosphate guanylyltransferase [Alkalicoccus saliphilus]|uniref:Uncharacterized protein n=1 Tax=Alkalicoccus saliphilus TaxID=200989 RepID=A0A2T4U9G3_9BACI|nr:bifunctional adenosylcobinamide kinase/adenosylcobinamide-phosphate guanylyltransferase [Alkalicoccus saliphilus]PTL40033.1 hypothetical protein C6Y45_03425 [Alkalicoccus saliphilus]
MHVVIGGAFAGKSAYVQQAYPKAQWVTPEEYPDQVKEKTIIVSGISSWLQAGGTEEKFWNWFSLIRKDLYPVLILQEMGQGLVPMDAEDRRVRDENGRIAQRAVKEAVKAEYVWHGLIECWKNISEENTYS